MNKSFVQYIAILLSLGFCTTTMAYSNSDCSVAEDLASTGLVYKQNSCSGYSLDRTIYRQEVAALALRVAEKCERINEIPTLNDYRCQNIFIDVGSYHPNSWACRSVEILAENGIVTTSRYNNGRAVFQPLQDITRAEALSIIMDSAGLDFRDTIYDDWRFSNSGAVSWQKPVMQYANDNDIITSINTFGPNKAAYRREVFSYVQKSIDNCLDGNQNNNSESNNFYVTTDDTSPTTNQWVDMTVKARDGTSTDTGYRGTVNFDVYYRSGSSSSWIKTTSSSYYEIDSDYDNGYTFTSSNDGQKVFNNLIRFKKNNYSYKIVVSDEDDEDIEGYKTFTVGSSGNDDDNNDDTDNFYLTTDDSSPTTNQWVDMTVKARDGTSTDTGYRGTVNFDVYYRSGSSSSWIKTTSSSYYEIDSDYDNGYTFTSSNDGQKVFNNLIRFKKNNYSYKVVVSDEDDDSIEGYKTFTVGSYDGDDCGYGQYGSGSNCYTCDNRPSNAYYPDRGSCDWICDNGYRERNGYCEAEGQNCSIGQYSSGNSCYNCTTKPSSASYTSYGTCDWSCNSGYYRDGNTCVSNSQTCGVGQYVNGNSCQNCLSAPAHSYYTTAGSCNWTCDINYYSSGSQCLPYTQNCGVGQYLSGNVCANCTTKPSNSIYSQTGTCDWTCDYGFMRDGNSCVQNQTYAWYNSGWSTCSANCGGGSQYRTVECRNQLGVAVSNYLCSGTMPSQSQPCNTQSCMTYSWQYGTWGTCTNGQQTRSASCQRSDGTPVTSGYCTTTPVTVQNCTSYSWYRGDPTLCGVTCDTTRNVVCQNSSGQIVADSNCPTSKPGHICARPLAWVATDSTQSCENVCAQANSCWVFDDQSQGCASGERMPTWGTFNYLFGTVSNPTIGGYWVWPYNGTWYCGSTNYYQAPAYRATEKVISCLCQ